MLPGWREEEARRRYAARYIPGERLYLDALQPASLADAVFVLSNTASPRLRMPR